MKCLLCNKKFKTTFQLAGHKGFCGKKRKSNWWLNKHNVWNKGLKTPRHVRDKISKSNKGKTHLQSEETKRKISETGKLRHSMGGYRHGSGRGKKGWYNSIIAGKVYLDSTYEFRFAKFLDIIKINWKRNDERFPYVFEGKIRNYIPDFYLIKSNEYVETKGFQTKQDEAKWKQFPKKLIVIFDKEIGRFEQLVAQ